MPIYDYTCAKCGHLVEVIHGMGEGGPRFCPSCGAEGTMRKGFAAPAVHFKGSGWAKKDRSSTASPGKSRPAKPESGGADSGSGDAAAASSTSTSTSTSTPTAGSGKATSSDGGD